MCVCISLDGDDSSSRMSEVELLHWEDRDAEARGIQIDQLKPSGGGYIVEQNLERVLDYIEANNRDDFTDPSLETCHHCHRKILSQYIEVSGKGYHREHVFCARCKQRDPYFRYFELNGEILCADCKGSNTCESCGKHISGTAIDVLGSSWHPECFKCHSCDKLLDSGGFVLRDKKTYCADKCPKIHVCASCGEPIYGPSISLNNVHLHANKDCFSCQTCKLPVDSTFCNFQGLPYCEKHYLEKVGVPICDGCNQAITGKSLLAIGKKWHPEHFVCSVCSKVLESSFQVDKGRPLCMDCIVNK
ncbi:transforming growth factor beta-1-induced transcript 1 protein-like isoform X4 [Schistocerca gregaria]|uniref:transforming growth factor beta-1-induced transcript 1 protein-like isoform X4 n=1 Tax=Schistocerca gregaria TaxID=7010 RepID=UPI00211F456B|nr:transforming growth factor beta-1-induced transcript 1 protein-like isoform X4 [Schistocerca gregaria]